MSESARVSGIGIHELLRYAIPGYSFLILLFLPFILVERLDLVLPNWELFVSVFLISGLIIGYFLYYIYYWYFRKMVHPCMCKKWLNNVESKTKETQDLVKLAIHTLAVSEEKERTLATLVFQYSVFHSIGVLLLSIWTGWLFSIVLSLKTGLITQLGFDFWIPLAVIASALFVLSYFLCDEYKYRTKLTSEIELLISKRHLQKVVEELGLEPKQQKQGVKS